MIHVEGLSKTYRVAKRQPGVKAALKSLVRPQFSAVEALRDLTFHVAPGEIVGYIGPNGAGKSSTIKVMSGILVPDSGTCRINGRVPWKDRIAHVRDIGVVFGQRSQLWWDVPVADSFELLRDIYRIPAADYAANRGRLVDSLDLGELLGVPVRQLSLGQRMRCEIAAALLHGPKILFLDEPTIGLDAPSKLAVRRFIQDLNRRRGTTVILTTHDMNDIEALARRIIMIGKGRILYDGDLEALRQKHGTERLLTVDFTPAGSSGAPALSAPAGQGLPALPGATLVSHSAGRAVWTVDTRLAAVSGVIARLSAALEIQDLTVEDPPVEELITRLYREHQV